VFNIDAAGEIVLVSNSSEKGIPLSRNESEVLGSWEENFLVGTEMKWPESVPRTGQQTVREYYTFIITSKEADFRALETSSSNANRVARGGGQADWSPINRYDVIHIPYILERRQPRLASELPAPESTEEWATLRRFSLGAAPASKGLIGQLIRTFKGVPPCVWVRNQSENSITVVVSKYRPNRLINGVQANVAPPGGGLNITTTVRATKFFFFFLGNFTY
jgi:hypothetical protein